MKVIRTLVGVVDPLKYYEIVSEPSNRAATFAISMINEYIQHKIYRSGTTSVQFLDEPYKTVYFGVAFNISSPFLNVFNEMIAKMEPNGLMEYWRRFQSFSRTKLEEVGPQVLTMDHLKIGFLACCIPMVLAVIAFIGEFAWSRIDAAYRKYSVVIKELKQNAIRASVAVHSCQEISRKQNNDLEESIQVFELISTDVHQKARIDFNDLIESHKEEYITLTGQVFRDNIDNLVENCDLRAKT